MDKLYYVCKFHKMIKEDINNGAYAATKDINLGDLKFFQNFFYRYFKNYERYEKMCLVSNWPVTLYGTAKT